MKSKILHTVKLITVIYTTHPVLFQQSKQEDGDGLIHSISDMNIK